MSSVRPCFGVDGEVSYPNEYIMHDAVREQNQILKQIKQENSANQQNRQNSSNKSRENATSYVNFEQHRYQEKSKEPFGNALFNEDYRYENYKAQQEFDSINSTLEENAGVPQEELILQRQLFAQVQGTVNSDRSRRKSGRHQSGNKRVSHINRDNNPYDLDIIELSKKTNLADEQHRKEIEEALQRSLEEAPQSAEVHSSSYIIPTERKSELEEESIIIGELYKYFNEYKKNFNEYKKNFKDYSGRSEAIAKVYLRIDHLKHAGKVASQKTYSEENHEKIDLCCKKISYLEKELYKFLEEESQFHLSHVREAEKKTVDLVTSPQNGNQNASELSSASVRVNKQPQLSLKDDWRTNKNFDKNDYIASNFNELREEKDKVCSDVNQDASTPPLSGSQFTPSKFRDKINDICTDLTNKYSGIKESQEESKFKISSLECVFYLQKMLFFFFRIKILKNLKKPDLICDKSELDNRKQNEFKAQIEIQIGALILNDYTLSTLHPQDENCGNSFYAEKDGKKELVELKIPDEFNKEFIHPFLVNIANRTSSLNNAEMTPGCFCD